MHFGSLLSQVGCFQGTFLQITDHLVKGFCANMLREAIEIEENNFPDRRKDLFMEQRENFSNSSYYTLVLNLVLSVLT